MGIGTVGVKLGVDDSARSPDQNSAAGIHVEKSLGGKEAGVAITPVPLKAEDATGIHGDRIGAISQRNHGLKA